MQKTTFIKSLSLVLCIVLIAAMALFTTGCNDNKNNETGTTVATEAPTEATEAPTEATEAPTEATEAPTEATEAPTDGKIVKGNGKVVFDFTVVEKDGKTTEFEIHTDKATVGDALTELKLIDGTVGEYGLMVTSVMGIVADYNVDKTYWAFYIDGEYASVGVDSAPVRAGATYMFKVEK